MKEEINPHGDNHDNVQCNQLITATPPPMILAYHMFLFVFKLNDNIQQRHHYKLKRKICKSQK